MGRAVAVGKEIRRDEFDSSVTVVVEKNGDEATLTKQAGSNARVLSGWNLVNPDANSAGSVATNATSSALTTA